MCSTTTEKRPAAQAKIKPIPPNQAGGPGGTPSAPAGPPAFDGLPEAVPSHTFIVQARVTPDGFIDPANTYHRNCGLAPSTITSIENLVSQLAGDTTRIARMRVVTHAHPQALAAAMFENSNVFQVDREFLEGFAQSDAAGLRAILGGLSHFANYRTGAIRTRINNGNPNLLPPFGSNPRPELDEVLRFVGDLALINLGLVRRGGGNLTNPDRTALVDALRFIATAGAAPLIGGAVNQGHVEALLDFGVVLTLADMQMTNASFNFATGTVDEFAVLRSALTAVRTNNFRRNLDNARKRFDENSFIDIRGCRAGDTEEYMRALQSFFGRKDHLPVVSAPRQFQFFGRCPVDRPPDNAAIRTLLTTGPRAAETRAGFDDWAKRSHVDPTHKDFWGDLLGGNAVSFCQLAWRTKIPAFRAPLATPGLANFISLSFRDTLTRIVALFRVAPASAPSGATLTALETFVTSKLGTWAPQLLAVANTTTPASQLSTLYNQLKTINDDLGQTLVPATPPANLTATEISGFQSALIQFLEANQLKAAKQFMTAVKARIDDSADPGLRYYMLQIGLPVFIFATTEQLLAGHAVNVTHNRLVVLAGATEDAAYRQWPPLLWATPLPSTNRFGTMHPTDGDAAHLQMMVASSDPGPSSVSTCPHPDYMDKVRVVRKPSSI